MSFYSIQKLANAFNIREKGKFLISLVYVFNTYFILLVDGGQLGIMLAYGVLPLAVESIIKFKFYKTLTVLSIITIFDPRFLLLSIILGLLLSKFNFHKIFKLLGVLVFVLLINFYWLLPVLKLGGVNAPTFVSSLKLVTIKDSLLLYQPHWPYNQFGKVTEPAFLFLIFPILLVVSNLIKPNKFKIYLTFLFLFFVFLAKGESRPFGEFYSYIMDNFPFASIFRDSTKFFPPLLITFSLIISQYYDVLKNKVLLYLIPIFLILPLVHGLLTGLNYNLKGLSDVKEIFNLKKITLDPNNFSRTAYIPEKPQLAFQTEQNQAIDGRVLVNYLPFASDNYGSEDRFNFMLRNHYINYFKSLGIKNLVYFLNGETLTAKIDNPMPEKYFIDKLAVVIGSPIGVEKLVPEYGVLFLEDGTTSLKSLLEKTPDKLFFILNNKNREDLVNSYFSDRFIDFSKIPDNKWAKYDNNDYLIWKYQLLIREIDTREINFGKGIVFSTIKDEEIKYMFNSDNSGKHTFLFRTLAGKDSQGISVNNKPVKLEQGNIFKWKSQELDLTKGQNEIIIKNKGGFNVISTAFLISSDEYKQSLGAINSKLNNFSIFNLNSKLPASKISFEPKIGWMIWNTSFDKRWNLGGQNPVVINSMTNGFEINEPTGNGSPNFTPQKYLDLGIKISLASVLAIIMSYFVYAIYKKRS